MGLINLLAQTKARHLRENPLVADPLLEACRIIAESELTVRGMSRIVREYEATIEGLSQRITQLERENGKLQGRIIDLEDPTYRDSKRTYA